MSGKIGKYTIDLLIGAVPALQQEIEIITKPGEDGHRRRRLGMRSEEFTLESTEHFLDTGKARDRLKLYAAMIDGPAVAFIKDDYEYSEGFNDNLLVAVLQVQENELRKKGCIAGTTNLWLLKVGWTLRLVSNA